MFIIITTAQQYICIYHSYQSTDLLYILCHQFSPN